MTPVPVPSAALAERPAPWHPAARVGFRFAFVYLALYNLPSLFMTVRLLAITSFRITPA